MYIYLLVAAENEIDESCLELRKSDFCGGVHEVLIHPRKETSRSQEKVYQVDSEKRWMPLPSLILLGVINEIGVVEPDMKSDPGRAMAVIRMGHVNQPKTIR